MPLYRRPKSRYWWTRFTVCGVKVRRSTETADREAAREYEDRLRVAIWRQSKLGDRPDFGWEAARDRWLAEKAHKRSLWRDRNIIAWFDEWLVGTKLAGINVDLIEKMRVLKAGQTSQATTNRHMALLRAILRQCAGPWDWLDKAPSVAMYPLEQQEPRYLTRAQFGRLKGELPEHMRPVAEFMVHTGLRMRNATHLEWADVDLKRGIIMVAARNAKGKRTIGAWLNSAAIRVVKAQRGRHPTRVFTFEGQPIDDINTAAWVKAKTRAGLPWVRVHDLRHTFASWHVQAGTPLHVLQELGAWKSDAMVRRYAHQSPDHLRQYAGHTLRTPRKPRARKTA